MTMMNLDSVGLFVEHHIDVPDQPSFCSLTLYDTGPLNLVYGFLMASLGPDEESWVVTTVAATKGYGPVLYDMLLVLIRTHSHAWFLEPSDVCSEQAKRLWDFYYNNRAGKDVLLNPTTKGIMISSKQQERLFVDLTERDQTCWTADKENSVVMLASKFYNQRYSSASFDDTITR